MYLPIKSSAKSMISPSSSIPKLSCKMPEIRLCTKVVDSTVCSLKFDINFSAVKSESIRKSFMIWKTSLI
ncbi:unknown [Acidaminococcus sp. CAG:917]|nr:unknown [Acidaminococcus sp. CAG:917]